jgi:hypothetical protein
MKKIPLIFSLALALLATVPTVKAQTLHAGDFGLTPGDDAIPAIRRALAACHAQDARKLVIPKGTYHFHPDEAYEEYLHISNNDDGLKRIAFPIHGFRNFEIDANGALFIMHGEMVTFDIQDSEDIILKNFSIDWNKPFYFQGQVTGISEKENAFDLRVYEECDYEIVADELIFLEKPGLAIRTWKNWAMPMKQDMGWEQNIDWNIWFDPDTKAGAYGAGPYALRSWNEELKVRYRVEEIEKGVLRFYNAAPRLPEMGWVLIVKGKKSLNRTSPAIHVYRSKNFTLDHVTVHHAGGMGFIAERTENVSLEGFDVRLPEGSGRMVTTTADATHFVNCRGLVSINNCHFENMLDDATNVHGIYTRVTGLVDDHTIGVRRVHGQQQGFLFATPGDSVRLSDKTSLEPYADLEVRSVVSLNSEYMEITFTENIEDMLRPGSVADNLTWQADLHMSNTTVRRNRARSILISTGGDVIVENNDFQTCTFTSILFEGDGTFWHESGPVNHVIIRHNRFRDFGLASGNAPLIQCSARVKFEDGPTYYYHHNILIENNRCEVFGRILANISFVDGFVFRGNKILKSTAYPLAPADGPVFNFRASRNILIENNDYSWDTPATIAADVWTENLTVSGNSGFATERQP